MKQTPKTILILFAVLAVLSGASVFVAHAADAVSYECVYDGMHEECRDCANGGCRCQPV